MASFTKLLLEKNTTITSQFQQQPPQPQPNHFSNSDFPIAIAILAIMAIAILIISYYIFVIKCCLNWQNIDPLRRFSISRRAQSNDETSLISFSPMTDIIRHRGLDEFLLNNIPAIQYKSSTQLSQGNFISNTTTNNNNALGLESCTSFRGCAVCLSPFEEKEMLRVLPKCKHTFHLDCIDVWLLNNASCPLCRSSISGRTKYPIDHIIAPTSSPQEIISPLFSGNLSMVSFNGDDQDYLVIEIGEEDNREAISGNNNNNCNVLTHQQEQRKTYQKKMLHNFSTMGDECINMRQKDDQFMVQQPIRRSFSMDSSLDRGLILQVQEIVRQNHPPLHYTYPIDEIFVREKVSKYSMYNGTDEVLYNVGNNNEVTTTSTSRCNNNDECNNNNVVANGRVRRSSFFPFGHGRGSRSSSIIPIGCDR